MTSTSDFETAARCFLEMVGRVQPQHWNDPALGSWDVRSLVGHTARAISTVEEYLSEPAGTTVTVPDAESYYSTVLGTYTDNESIAARGVAAGAALTEHSGEEFAELLDRVLVLIEQNGPERIVVVRTQSIPLGEYLRTRVFELVVHGMDISHAVGIDHGIPEEIIARTAGLAATVAVRSGHGEDILFAMTGRRPLPARFSIL